MHLLRVWCSRTLAVFSRRHLDTSLNEEIAAHLDHLADEYRRRGLSAGEARGAARRAFGGVDAMKDTYRHQRGLPIADMLLQDVRYALRTFRRTPTFTLATILTLALGIGATTAVFSVVDSVLLRPLPYPKADRVLALSSSRSVLNSSQTGELFHHLKARVQALTHIAAYREGSGWNLVAGDRAEYVRGLAVSSGYFAALGIAPILGREFSESEDLPNGPPAVMLSDAVWRRHFNARADTIGKVVRLGAVPHTIVGILPAGFASIPSVDVWTPLRLSPRDGTLNYTVIGRLREEATAHTASAELESLKPGILSDLSGTNGRNFPQRIETLAWLPYQDIAARNSRYPLMLLLGAVGFVLLITCANVAGLQLVRAIARRREMATRAALGGGVGRAVFQIFTESVLLGLFGALGGLIVASACLRTILPFIDQGFLVGQSVAIDWRVLGVTGAVAFAVAAIVGVLPALEVARIDVRAAIGEGGTRVTASRAARWARRGLLLAEVALGCVLLTGAGLFGRALFSLTRADLGFDPNGVLVAHMSLQPNETPDGQPLAGFYERTLERVRTVSGVDAAAVSITVPVARAWNFPIEPAGRIDSMRSVDWQYATPQYFRVFGVPMRAGRSFDDRDGATTPGVAIVNEAFARAYFGSSDAAIGERIQLARAMVPDPPRTIIGVAGDVKAGSGSGWTRGHALAAPVAPTVFFPAAQMPQPLIALVHRSAPVTWAIRLRDPQASSPVPHIQRIMRDVAPELPFIRFATMNEVIGDSVGLQRVLMLLLSAFAFIALTLTAVGIYGLVAHGVAQRRREIGIRIALGSSAAQVVRRFMNEAVVLSLIGATLGLAGAVGLTRLLGILTAVIFGIDPIDPVTFAGVALILVLVAGLAAWLPARRAARVDPVVALRSE